MNREHNGTSETSVFRGRSMQDAIGQLKAALGPDAVIVGTTRGNDRAGRYVEITATAPNLPNLPVPRSSNPLVSNAYAKTAKTTLGDASSKGASGPFADRAQWLAKQVASRVDEVVQQGATPVDELMALRDGALPSRSVTAPDRAQRYVEVEERLDGESDDLASLRSSVDQLSKKLAELSGEASTSSSQVRANHSSHEQILVERLECVGVAREYAAQTAKRAFTEVPDATCDDGDLLRSVQAIIAEDMTDYQDAGLSAISSRITAFVGATGIGKTTTIAKLATQAKLRGESVALITMDTIRLAAVDQLTRFSQVLDVPLKVVARPSELACALDEFQAFDRIFVDTPGKSPYAPKQVRSLLDYFPENWGGTVVLTVSSTARQMDLFQNLDAFSTLSPSGVCVTKLDETNAIGAAYSAMRRSGLPLLWLTDGQRIPEDIEVCDPKQYASDLLSRLRMMSSLTSAA